jgi:hypothetical protein
MYELGVYIPEDGILHSRRRETLKSYRFFFYMKLVSFENSDVMEYPDAELCNRLLKAGSSRIFPFT